MKDQLKTSMKEAMKAKDKLGVETIRSLLSALQYEEMSKKTEDLSNEQSMAVIKGELKKQQESLEYAEKDGRDDLIAEAKARVATVEKFLPKQLSRDELASAIQKIKDSNPDANIGVVMKQLGTDYPGQYNGKLASEVAREILN